MYVRMYACIYMYVSTYNKRTNIARLVLKSYLLSFMTVTWPGNLWALVCNCQACGCRTMSSSIRKQVVMLFSVAAISVG